MKKHYEHHYSAYGGYAMNPKVGEDLKDVDDRLDRLEKLARAQVLDPNDIPVGTTVMAACEKLEKAAKETKALADSKATWKMPVTKLGLRTELTMARDECADLETDNADLVKINKRLADDNAELRKELEEAGKLWAGEHKAHCEVARKLNEVSEEYAKFKSQTQTKLRQLATSLSQS